MFKILLGAGLGYLFSIKLNRSKHWYIKKNEKFVKLDTSDIITYLHNDYKQSKENIQYEFLDFIVDFEKSCILLDSQWQKIYYI